MESPPGDSKYRRTPRPLIARSPTAWLALFGPGAIIASLTIGTGELIFSTRGGALFGYDILFLFVVISVCKWACVVAMARHMVLCGVHPFARMASLPGPRGWLPLLFFLLGCLCFPIWISFHSGVLGNLTAWITGTRHVLNGGIDYIWGTVLLAATLLLSATRGYALLERVQLLIVGALITCAAAALLIHRPDWLDIVEGTLIPRRLHYPGWLSASYPDLARQPVWVEMTRYVGVIGGAGFDYLAYVSFLRDKQWGQAGWGPATPQQVSEIAGDVSHPIRTWVRAPLIDCSISFAVVVGFCVVFVVSGALVLGPAHKIPDETRFLDLQAQFVTRIHPWLLPLYVCGAFLAMLGTLYGTIEVACVTFREMGHVVLPRWTVRHPRRVKVAAIAWCSAGALLVLAWLLVYRIHGGLDKPRLLLAILTPANLFTGVLSCGVLCWLIVWLERRALPPALFMPRCLAAVNLIAGFGFLALGIKGYWDDASRDVAVAAMAFCLVAALAVAGWLARGERPEPLSADSTRGQPPSPG